jgi:hypothetical protein
MQRIVNNLNWAMKRTTHLFLLSRIKALPELKDRAKWKMCWLPLCWLVKKDRERESRVFTLWERARVSKLCEASPLYQGILQYRSIWPGFVRHLWSEQVQGYPDFRSCCESPFCTEMTLFSLQLDWHLPPVHHALMSSALNCPLQWQSKMEGHLRVKNSYRHKHL